MLNNCLNKLIVVFGFFALFNLSIVKIESAYANPLVLMETSKGDIKIELFENEAPITVKNFLSYVSEGFYDNLIFHRVIKNFMIQGGGFDAKMNQKNPKAPIKNEATNGLKNKKGTIAMARTNVVDSATSQFFINVADNDFLDHQNKTSRGYGYAVFGKVVEGMDVVDSIVNVKTGSFGSFRDVPIEPVIIKSLRLAD
ncbi:MAG: peptidylprolyl isomerase [Candidatus Scalinduaceae bacterium]